MNGMVHKIGRYGGNKGDMISTMSTMILCNECGKYFYATNPVLKICERCLNNGSMRS